MKKIRKYYGEIDLKSIKPSTMKIIKRMIEEVKKSDKIDEHGGWDFGAEFDYNGRGSALNWDIYDYGKDYFNKKFLIILQVRQYIIRKKSYYPQIRKNYYLIGRNEDNSVFAHCIEGRIVHNAIKKGQNILLAVQSWIFDSDYKEIFRHGDIGFVKVKKQKGEKTESNVVVLPESHKVTADEIYKYGNTYYVQNPVVVHLNNVHPNLELSAWYKVLLGKRNDYWSFASPTID